MLILGNFSEEFTDLGLTIQIILGLVGVDLIFDIRDLIADLTVNFEPTAPEWWSQIGLGIVAFLPAVGLLKFSDELSTASKGGWKALIKNTDEIAAGAKPAVRNAAEIIQAGKRNSEDLAKQIRKLTKETGEQAEDILDDLRKVEKAADGLDVVEDVTDVARKTQKAVIESVENSAGGSKTLTNIQKGNYGEMKMDDFFESKGYQRISTDRVTDLDAPTHQGIDGVYYKADGHPPYIIGEAKYGNSNLGVTLDGKQMSRNWIDNRLDAAVGKDIANEIRVESMLNPENVQSQLVKITYEGDIENKLLDATATVTYGT